MATRKSQKPTPTSPYLKQLQEDKQDEQARFNEAKAHLYVIIASSSGKLFNSEFESARSKCLEINKRLNEIDTEILRVKLALRVVN